MMLPAVVYAAARKQVRKMGPMRTEILFRHKGDRNYEDDRKWIGLGIIIWSEVTQIQKGKCHILSHTEILAFYV